ncbi:hypothetical protein EYC08_16900 [Tabrizicola sp. WMC-M-20]|nr:hypothetical protein EYC08_16900 [Tabrizicola sp. WMC-M-20]
MLGAVLSLISAAFFGLNNAATRRGVLAASVLQGMAITVPLGLPLFLLFLPLFGGFSELFGLSRSAVMWLAAAGIVHFVIGRYGNYRATQALGATLSTPVQQLSILVSLGLAIVFLGEVITGLKVAGLVLVMIGPGLVLARRKAGKKMAANLAFTPEYGPGFFWGAVCALGYGVSPVMITVGMGDARSIPVALAGIIVSYGAATVVVALMVAIAGGRSYMASVGRGAVGWFLVSTVAVALSQMLRYMALAVAPVSVVVPIQRLSVLFRLIFGALINRDSEVLDGVVIFGIILAVFGTVALAVDTETVRATVPSVPVWMLETW